MDVPNQTPLAKPVFASEEAEKAIIGCFLTAKETVKDITQLSDEDFYYEKTRCLFKAIRRTLEKEQAIDLVTVDASLTEMYPSSENILIEAAIDCGRAMVTSVHFDSYLATVKDLSARRQSIRMVGMVQQQLQDPANDMQAILDKLRMDMKDAVYGKHKWSTMADVLLATYEYLEKRAKGEVQSIATGIPNVDAVIGGFFGGELTVIGARPSVGKSAFGANIAIHAAQMGFRVAICSREMTDIQFGQRILSYESLIDGMKIRNAEIEADEWGKLAESMSVASQWPVEFLFTVRTIEDLRSEVQRRVEKGEIDMLIVDYLQLMRTTQRFREEHLRVGYISKSLKDMAVDFNIPVIALAQVNRDTDGQMPTLKSLKASGDIEQDADGVIFLHRPFSADDEYVDPRDREHFGTYEEKGLTYLCIGVAKQRQGATGKACVLFDPAHMRYYAIDRARE